MRIVRHQLTKLNENPVEQEFSNSPDMMLNSNSKWVSILSTPTLVENQVSLLAQTFIPDNSKLISLDMISLKIMWFLIQISQVLIWRKVF